MTAGGVPLEELHGATLESRLAPGLYFAGEILDTFEDLPLREHAVRGLHARLDQAEAEFSKNQ